MRSLVSIISAFVILSLLAFLGINWVSTIPAPSDSASAEYQIYTNLTDTTDMAYTAQEGILLLVVACMVIVGVLMLVRWLGL